MVYIIKGGRKEKKRKEDFKGKKFRTVLFRNPKAHLTGCMGPPPGFRKVLRGLNPKPILPTHPFLGHMGILCCM